MKIVAIPKFGERISPRLDYAESLLFVTIESNNITKKENIKIIAHSNLERINLIIGLTPDIVICDGISDLTYNKLIENNIEVIPWIHGTVEEVLDKYLNRTLLKKAVKNTNKI
jgi:predicted Fe-Mo cluster-binding NifX family protein